MHVLVDEGWLCASRRHIGGAGDVLAVRKENTVEIAEAIGLFDLLGAMLIEVKSTAGGPWERFGPKDRQDLTVTAEKYGADPYLYWWPPRGILHRIPASDFPKSERNAKAETP
jgi:hypothetical protein